MASVRFDRVDKTYADGTRAVRELDLEIADGEFLVFVGPSGCGKTTALRMVAGLESITGGELLIGDQVVNGLEPQKRDIAMVFQNYALYPHMSVFDNIAFPLASQRVDKTTIKREVERTAALLGLSEQLKRRPRHLSGGQRQRVAMGRAIVRQPQAFLMDEPLSNLDAKLRVQMRSEISHLQRKLGTTTVYVTHDQVEALTMGDRIAVLRKGVLQQLGSPGELYDNPSNIFVATFVGSPAMNLVLATVETDAGDVTLRLAGGESLAPPSALAKGLAGRGGGKVAVGMRAEHLLEPGQAKSGAPRVAGLVKRVESLGSEKLVHVEVHAEPVITDAVIEVAKDVDAANIDVMPPGGDQGVVVIARFDADTSVKAGDRVELAPRVDRLRVFDLETGDAIDTPERERALST